MLKHIQKRVRLITILYQNVNMCGYTGDYRYRYKIITVFFLFLIQNIVIF